jgi:hypothetical protein
MGISYFLYWGERLPYGQGFDSYSVVRYVAVNGLTVGRENVKFRLEKMFEKVGETFSKILQIVQCMPTISYSSKNSTLLFIS